jgi:hypothetical protein
MLGEDVMKVLISCIYTMEARPHRCQLRWRLRCPQVACERVLNALPLGGRNLGDDASTLPLLF